MTGSKYHTADFEDCMCVNIWFCSATPAIYVHFMVMGCSG